jgi:protein required for attachment to host cells
MMNETWILVANASSARLFHDPGHGKEWKLLSEREHPESRAQVHELVEDDRGRAQNSSHPGGVALEPRTDPKEVEAKRFAHELGRMLEKGADDHEYERLMIVAPPHFLGLLRAELADKVARRVTSSVDKDYHELTGRELSERLGPL